MNSSERVAREWQQAQYNQLVQDMRPSTARDTGGGGPVGGGVGNLAGWVLLAAMIGAIVGGILGGLPGVFVGAVLLALPLWAVGALARRGGGSAAVSRLSVLLWAVGGALAGTIVGALIAGGDGARMGNAMLNWSIFGGVLAGGYRLWKRTRG